MDFSSIASRVAGYDFKTKMKINSLVIEEIARNAGTDNFNDIANGIAESTIHSLIQQLADAISEEASRFKSDSNSDSKAA